MNRLTSQRLLVSMLLISTQGLAEIPEYYQRVSVQKQIPAAVLYAIAMQESKPPAGIIQGISGPWPWTLNCQGQGYYLPTQVAAFNLASQFIDSGFSCDIGLMQISWRYHKERFSSLSVALDPITNIQAGSDYLMELFNKTGSWEYAIGAYHSPSNPVKASRYREKVRTHLINIMGVSF